MKEEIIRLKEELKLQHALRLKSEEDWEKSNNFYKDLYLKELEKSSNKYAKELEHTIRLRDERISNMVDRIWFTECLRLQEKYTIGEELEDASGISRTIRNISCYKKYKLEYLEYRMLYLLLIKDVESTSKLNEDDKVYLHNERLKGYK